jgi:hypothetical protein
MLSRLWKSWTESWRSPERARKQYTFVAVAFGVLTVIAFAIGEPLVGMVGAAMMLFVAALAYFAPRLVERTRVPADESGDESQ